MSSRAKSLFRGPVVAAVIAAGVWVSGPPIVSVSADAPADASHQGDSTTVISVDGVDMVVHQFTTAGAVTFTPPLAVTSVEYLVVGGGGGGGARYGGGGGGGGVVSGTLEVVGGQAIAVVVGAGGAGGVQRTSGVSQGPGVNGTASSLGVIVGSGGGGGGAGNAAGNTPGRAGASGGGGGGVINTSTVALGGAATQGSAGGASGYGIYDAGNLALRYLGLVAGGGGGSTGVGGAGNHATRTAGDGGSGATSSITGTSLGYGGGGGGGAYTSEYFASDQTPGDGRDGGGDGTNTDTTPTRAVRGGGGGGGGLSGEGRDGSGGGGGGDGIVIVRYPVSSTTTTLTSSTSRTSRDDTVTLAVTVGPADTTGVVTVSDGTADRGTCTLTRAEPGECTVELDDLSVGTHVFTATYAGSAAYLGSVSSSVSVEIDPAEGDVTARGFAHPIDSNGVVNTAKAGSTIPLKFSATIDGEPVSDLSYVAGFAVTQVMCNSLSAVTDEVEVTTTGGTQLRFDHTTQQFILNWKLPTTKNRCYRARVDVLGADTSLIADVMTR